MQTTRSFVRMDAHKTSISIIIAEERHEHLCPVSRSDPERARAVIQETCLLLAERQYSGSQLDWLLQKDQVTRIQFKSLRIRY